MNEENSLASAAGEAIQSRIVHNSPKVSRFRTGGESISQHNLSTAKRKTKDRKWILSQT
jgi:hypothetical protein